MTNTNAKIMREQKPANIWHPSRFEVLIDFDGSFSLVGKHGFDIASGFHAKEAAWEHLASQGTTS